MSKHEFGYKTSGYKENGNHLFQIQHTYMGYYPQTDSLLMDYLSGDDVKMFIWFRQHEMCNYRNRNKLIKDDYKFVRWMHDDIKDLNLFRLTIDCKRADGGVIIIHPNGELFVEWPDHYIREIPWVLFGFFEKMLWLRSCVIQDFVNQDNERSCKWALDRMLEHTSWHYVRHLQINKGNTDNVCTFRDMFEKTIEEWEATGNAWPLGDINSTSATHKLEMARQYNEMTKPKPKRAKTGLLL